jgi:hypothetical protein
MVAGHTKFSPDRFFGLIKKLYRQTNVSSLQEIERMVLASCIAGKNIPLPTVDCVGKRNVIWYCWNDFLSKYFTTIPNITKYHHFQFKKSRVGLALIKEFHNDDKAEVNMLLSNSELVSREMPKEITPPGLSYDRKKYLYEKIRPFCTFETADVTCPIPDARPRADGDLEAALPAKNKSVQRKCSHCRQPGHTKTVKGVIVCPVLLKN